MSKSSNASDGGPSASAYESLDEAPASPRFATNQSYLTVGPDASDISTVGEGAPGVTYTALNEVYGNTSGSAEDISRQYAHLERNIDGEDHVYCTVQQDVLLDNDGYVMQSNMDVSKGGNTVYADANSVRYE